MASFYTKLRLAQRLDIRPLQWRRSAGIPLTSVGQWSTRTTTRHSPDGKEVHHGEEETRGERIEGFGDCKLFKTIAQELGFAYVIRIRGDIYVTSAKGERRKAAQWVGQGGRSRTLRGAQVTDEHHLEVGRVVCVHDRKMKEPWCLVASESTVGTRTLIRYYGKRWGIETSFRDIKDMRFGMGLSARRVSSPQRRDRMLLLSALAIALLSLLGGAGESLGYDRWLKVNTAKYRTHSLFRQGLMLYDHIPNWSDERVCPLMERFSEMLMEQRVFKEIFGVI